MNDVSKEAKEIQINKNNRETKLTRALEEVDKYKTQLKTTKDEYNIFKEESRKKTESLENEIRRIERQKTELLSAFKKQMKLIDVLKRQKLHIEAAKLLNFTEDEFSKILELGSSL